MTQGCTPEYNQHTRDLMAKLEGLRAQAKEAARNQSRQTQLEKQSAGMKEKIKAGDLSRPAKREPIQYDQGVMHALMERNRLRGQIENLIAKGDRLNRSPVKKVLGIVHDLQMGAILASWHVFKKLGYAVAGGHVQSLLGDVTRSAVRNIPGIRGIAEQSPQYGHGLNWDALKARWQGVKEAPKQALEQLNSGQATREATMGNTARASDEYMTHIGTMAEALKTEGRLNKVAEVVRTAAGYVGRTHAAEKEFLAQPEFREGIARQSKFLIEQMQKEKMPPEAIKAAMENEVTQGTIGAKALERAYESKMQGKNPLSAGMDAFIGTLDRSDNVGANFLGFAIKTMLPIRKVGVNVAKQGTSLMAGGVKALVSAMKKGEMTEERANYIMKNIGQQGAGAVLMTAGILYLNKFGGVPGVFSKKEQPVKTDAEGNPIKAGEAEGLGTEAFHGAPFAMMQIGASMAQLYNKEYGRKNGIDFALKVAGEPTLNWLVRTIPYTDAFRRWKNTMELGRGRKEGLTAGLGEIAGDTAAGWIPGVIKQYAAETDPYKGFRKPRNIKEDLKLGIPGLREEIPTH